jgi:hypothetical protein
MSPVAWDASSFVRWHQRGWCFYRRGNHRPHAGLPPVEGLAAPPLDQFARPWHCHHGTQHSADIVHAALLDDPAQ